MIRSRVASRDPQYAYYYWGPVYTCQVDPAAATTTMTTPQAPMPEPEPEPELEPELEPEPEE